MKIHYHCHKSGWQEKQKLHLFQENKYSINLFANNTSQPILDAII